MAETVPTSKTRFGDCSKPLARAILVAFLALMLLGIFTTGDVSRWVFGSDALSDVDLFREVVQRVHSGENFYDVWDHIFRRNGVPTRSVFNWRLPTFAWVFGSIGNTGSLTIPSVMDGLLPLLALISVALVAKTILAPQFGKTTTILGLILLLGGVFSWALYDYELYLMTEPWCEVFLLLSLSAYAAGRWPLGVACAAVALAFRELALPYCAVAMAFALVAKRRGEIIAWIGVFAVLGAFFIWHTQQVLVRVEDAPFSANPWMGGSGLKYLVRVSAMNVFLRTLPGPVLAVYVSLAVLGLASWRGEIGARMFLSTAAYLVPFLLIRGHDYWGFLITPMMLMGLMRSPVALRELVFRKHSPDANAPPVVVP